MQPVDDQLESIRRSRLLAADRARRRQVLLALLAAFTVLSALATAQVAVLQAPRLVVVVTALATFAFAALWLIARRDEQRDPGTLAVWMLLVTQVQHLLSTVGAPRLADVRLVLTFTALTPLLAAALLRVRGTVLVSFGALATALAAAALTVAGGSDVQAVSKVVSGPLFLMMMAGAIAIILARASRRALRAQLQGLRETEQAEAERRAAERRFQLIADQVSDLVSVVDARGRPTFASASFEHLLGVSLHQMEGDELHHLVHPDDLQAMARAVERALAKENQELVLRLRSHDGDYRTFHVRLLGVDVNGEPHAAMTARDITELQALTAELESARRMEALGRLAGGVAHDFNNMLSVIGTCASMATQRVSEDHPVQRDLAMIDQVVTRAADLTGQLLAFARRQVLPRSRAAPGHAVERLRPLLQRAVGSHVELRFDVDADWVTHVAESQLEQVLMNLIVNARDAMPRGGRIDVRVHDRQIAQGEVPQLEPGDYVVLEVQDQGTGMDEETRARIFEPFFTTKRKSGTGLGLATSFGIARQAGGNLVVESSPGAGSTFRLYLPRDSTPEATDATPQAPARQGASTRRVLVVDDEPHICEVVSELVRLAGMEVETASGTEQALELAGQSRFDSILTDVVLGGEDALEVLEKLRELQPSARLVVMSGFTPSPERLEALRETGILFLAKPFATQELLDALGG